MKRHLIAFIVTAILLFQPALATTPLKPFELASEVTVERVGFGQPSVKASTTIKKISIKNPKKPLRIGEQLRLQIAVKYKGAKPKATDLRVYSTDTSVARVSDLGKQGFWVEPYKEGNTTIMVECLGASKSITLPIVGYAPTAVSLDKETLTLQKGTTYQLQGSVLPTKANQKLTWKSNKTGVVKVSNIGLVTAKKAGTAVVTAKSDNGIVASCAITVQNEPVAINPDGITLNKSSLTLNLGASETLNANVTPSSATDKTVRWASSNVNVATVSGGTVTAKAVGSTVITAATVNGNVATCTVKVEILPTKIELDQSDFILKPGNSHQINATVTPSNATNKTITWSSSDPSAVTVVDGLVTANAHARSAIITARTANGLTATCEVAGNGMMLLFGAPRLEKSDLTLTVGTSYTLRTSEVQNVIAISTPYVKWSSTDPSVVTVEGTVIRETSSGFVLEYAACILKPYKPGTATIIATMNNSGLKSYCTVTVKAG